jgi:hypothetical protein
MSFFTILSIVNFSGKVSDTANILLIRLHFTRDMKPFKSNLSDINSIEYTEILKMLFQPRGMIEMCI